MLATKWQPLRIPHGFGFSRISYLSDAENVVQAREKHANGKACQRKTMRMSVVEFEMVLLKVFLGDFC